MRRTPARGGREGDSPAPRAGRRPVVAAVVVAATALTLGWLGLIATGSTTFVVRDGRTGEVLHDRSVSVGETVRLEHTHSVTRRRVVETFSVADASTIAIEELWFDAPGPNLPTGPESVDGYTTTFIEEDGAVRVLHHGRPIGTVPLIVGSGEVDHVVVFEDGERVRLLDLARRGQPIELTATRWPPRS